MAAGFQPLPHYGFGPVQRVDDDSYRIAALPARQPTACPHCAGRELAGFGRRDRAVADLPLHGRPVSLVMQVRRFRCGDCQRTFYEALPDIDPKRHMSLRLKRWIGKEAKRRSGVEIAAEAGISEGTVRQVLKDLAADAS